MTLIIRIIRITVIEVHRPNYEQRSLDADSSTKKPYTMHPVIVQYNALTFIGPATFPLSHTHQGLSYSDKNRTYRAEKHKQIRPNYPPLHRDLYSYPSSKCRECTTGIDITTTIQEHHDQKGFLYTYFCYFRSNPLKKPVQIGNEVDP